MSKYQAGKANARELAIEYQSSWDWEAVSWEWLVNRQAQLMKLGKRHGLLKEFRENGII